MSKSRTGDSTLQMSIVELLLALVTLIVSAYALLRLVSTFNLSDMLKY